VDRRAHPRQERGQRADEERERRRARVVRAADQGQAPPATVGQERRHDRLGHEQGRAGAADVEAVVTRHQATGREGELGRAQARAVDGGARQRRRGLDAGQVLPQEAGLGPPGADVADGEALAGGERQRQRRADDLAAAFAVRAVDREHGGLREDRAPPNRRETRREEKHRPAVTRGSGRGAARSLSPSRTPPAAAYGPPRPGRPAPPSPDRSACRPPGSRRSRRRPCGTRCRRSPPRGRRR
jgi:hypothetical protein